MSEQNDSVELHPMANEIRQSFGEKLHLDETQMEDFKTRIADEKPDVAKKIATDVFAVALMLSRLSSPEEKKQLEPVLHQLCEIAAAGLQGQAGNLANQLDQAHVAAQNKLLGNTASNRPVTKAAGGNSLMGLRFGNVDIPKK